MNVYGASHRFVALQKNGSYRRHGGLCSPSQLHIYEVAP
jgi:hypothetical protein